MAVKKVNLMLGSRSLVAILAMVLLFAGVILLAEGLVDTKNIKDELTRVVKENTGKDIAIRGKITVAMLPSPTIYIPGVDIRDASNDSPAPSLSVDMVKLRVSPFSLFSNHPDITGITLEEPALEIERAHDGVIHWDWLSALLMKLPGIPGSGGIGLAIVDGKLLYRNEVDSNAVPFENIYVSGSLGAPPSLSGTFDVFGREVQVSLKKDGAASADGMPLILKVSGNAANSMQWQGALDLSKDAPAFKGKFSLDSDNILPWLHTQAADDRATFAKITNESTQQAKDTTVYPIKLTADWQQSGLNMTFSNIALQGVNSTGSGKIALNWNEDMPVLDIEADFASLDYNVSRKLIMQALEYYGQAVPQGFGYHSDEPDEGPIPKNVQATLNVKAEQVLVGAQTWKQAQVLVKLSDATLTVDQFNVELPGDSTLGLFGVISEGTTGTKGLRFEGNMETKGKSLRQMLTVFDESAKDLPDTGFGDFYVRSNIFVSPEQLRLSEADAKISDLHLNGGLVAYFDANPRIEADMKLKDINFDYFRDVWRRSQQDTSKQDFFLKDGKSMNFGWLKKLQTTIDFRVNVDKFTFLDRRGETASFRLFARQNEFGIYDIHLAYPQDMTEASIKLDVSGAQPSFDVLLNTSELDTSYFSLNSGSKPSDVVLSDEKPINSASDAAASKALPIPPPPPPPVPIATPDGQAKKVEIKPQAEQIVELAQNLPPVEAKTVEDLHNPAPPPTPTPAAADAVKKRWSEDLIDMSWMDGISGTFDISAGKLTHDGNTLNNFKFHSRLDNDLLTIQSLGFNYWQGKCQLTGSLYGGTVPGMSISFTMYDTELRDILKSLVGWGNVSGRISLSGSLATSGVNYLSWLQQAESKLVVAGRGVIVDGINLDGAVNAVQVSRTASDVLNNVNIALLNGSTEFSVDGNLNVKNGAIRTPGITLKTGDITGNLTGEIDMVRWKMALATLFQFPAMTSETVPTMAMTVSGPIEHAQLQTDTASLEAYVAKRIVGH